MSTGRWLRLHSAPRQCYRGATLGGRDEWTARARWYFERSYERWKLRPESQEVLALFGAAWAQGEIGHYEGVRFIESKGNS